MKNIRQYFACLVKVEFVFVSVAKVILWLYELEPVCCKKRQKKVPTKKLVWGIEDI